MANSYFQTYAGFWKTNKQNKSLKKITSYFNIQMFDLFNLSCKGFLKKKPALNMLTYDFLYGS